MERQNITCDCRNLPHTFVQNLWACASIWRCTTCNRCFCQPFFLGPIRGDWQRFHVIETTEDCVRGYLLMAMNRFVWIKSR